MPLAEDETHGNLLAWVRVLHRARYSPHDDPVERIWGALKAYLANSPTPAMAGRIRQVHAFFRQPSPAQLLVTAAPHSSPWLPNEYEQNNREAAQSRRSCRPCGDVVDGRTPYGD